MEELITSSSLLIPSLLLNTSFQSLSHKPPSHHDPSRTLHYSLHEVPSIERSPQAEDSSKTCILHLPFNLYNNLLGTLPI